MPIRILDIPDPFTIAARISTDRPLRIESDAYRQLVHELRRYCSGEVAGRSFLIAGHRGAGKTTLVSSAFDELLREQVAAATGTGTGTRAAMNLRPLPVLLQGPTLLPSSAEELPYAIDGTGDAGRRLSEMENVLVQIILGLHRAVAAEMMAAFRAHAWRVTSETKQFDGPETLELAAHLQLELDDYTNKARLRDLWRRGGALTHGVLYARDPVPLRYDGMRDVRKSDQGVRELVALASVCDAYRRISGKINRKDERKSDISGKTERSAEIDAKGKDFAGPIIAALTGGAVGTATLAGTGNTQVAALAGVLTALAGMVAGKVSVSRKQERSISSEDLFIPDLSVATMDRILPVLLDRLRNAGLAPVFVVDELDKVEGLSERILGMIRRLKKIVAENACFCFLADRSYFEEMRQRTAASPYSIEHTYFTHQLFVSFRHADMRKFLEQILVRPAEPAPDPARAGAPPQPVDAKVLAAIREDQTDHDLLPYILLHSAQMHPIDLMRQIAQIRSADGNVILEPGLVRSRRRYLLELLVQLAIELQLEQQGMQEELDRRPAFRRLAHDAMYYLSRQWEQDADAPLSLGEAGRVKFEGYLIGRMALEKREKEQAEKSAPKPGTAKRYLIGEPDQPENTTPKPVPISGEDVNFLWDNVRDLAQKLASPESIRAEYMKRGITQNVVDALDGAIKLRSLLEPHGQDVYRWRYRRSGRETQPPAPPVAAAVARLEAAQAALWEPNVKTIRRFESALRAATGVPLDPSTLSTGLGILPTTPAWPQVSAGLVRLESVTKDKPTYPEMPEDEAVVNAYAAMLESHVPAVALSIYCAKALHKWVGFDTALAALSQVFAFQELSPPAVVREVKRIHDDLAPLTQGPVLPENASVGSWIDWIQRLSEWDVPSYEVPISIADEAAGWEYWRWRLGLRSERPAATLKLFYQAVLESGAFSVVKPSPWTMTLRDWSLLFYRSVMAEPDSPPAWIGLEALHVLGWRDRKILDLWADGVLSGVKMSPAETSEAISHWASVEARDVPSRVFIGNYTDSESESWQVERVDAAVTLRVDEWLRLLRSKWSQNRKEIVDAFSPNIVAADVSTSGPRSNLRRKRLMGGSTSDPEATRTFLDAFSREREGVSTLIIAGKDQKLDAWSRYRIIVEPKTLSDFVARVTTNTSSPAS